MSPEHVKRMGSIPGVEAQPGCARFGDAGFVFRSCGVGGDFGRSEIAPLHWGVRGGAGVKFLVFLAVVFAMFALAWMLFLPVVATAQLRQRTGFDAQVQSLAVNPFSGTVEIRGLVVTNPPTFPVHDFLEVRRFSANAELFSLFSDRPIFATMEVEVARVTLVRRDAVQTNAASFEQNLAIAGDPAAPSSKPKALNFLIRRLNVRIDELVISDHSAKVPVVHTYKLALNQSYTDVTGVRQLLAPSTLQSLLPVASALKGLLPGALGDAFTDVVKEATKSGAALIRDTSHKAGEKIKGYFDALEESKKP
ncbi:MAG: hypothetical protein JWM32_2247 [Verrucomicrobia bacterium]|nr:hypothetical protein [Verrucomicrobiota bacterium]